MAVRKKKVTHSRGKTRQGKKKGDHPVQVNRTGTLVTKKETSANVCSNNKKNRQSVAVTLDPIITLTEVTALKEKFLEYIDAEEIRIDASKVEHIDTGGLQLLLAFSKVYKNQGGQIIWQGWSASCLNIAKLLGLAESLNMKE